MLDTTKISGRNGTYSLFVDDSALAAEAVNSPITCMVIQSKDKNSPFNTIVRIDDVEEFDNTFGLRDFAQERQGNYSILLGRTMLENLGQPMYFVNIRDYEDSQTTQIVSLSSNNSASNDAVESVTYKTLFDRSNMWKIDRENFVTLNSNEILNFASIRSNNLTIYVRQAATLPDTFDDTIGEHKTRYPKINIDYLPDDMLIKDTFVDVYVFNRKLTSSVATNNPTLSNLINNSGQALKSDDFDVLDELSTKGESGFVGKYTGSIAKEITSINGERFPIELLINADAKNTGLGLFINEEVLHEHIDWDFDTGAQPSTISFAQHNLTVNGANYELPASTLLSYTSTDATSGTDGLASTSFSDLTAATIHTNNVNAAGYQLNSGNWDGTYDESVGFISVSIAPVVENGMTVPNQVYLIGNENVGITDKLKVVASDDTLTDITNIQQVATHRQDPVQQTVDLVVHTDKSAYPRDADGTWRYPTGHANEGEPVTFGGTNGRAETAPNNATDLVDVVLTAEEIEAFARIYGHFTDVKKITTRKAIDGVTTGVNTAATFECRNIFDLDETFTITDIVDDAESIRFVRTIEDRVASYNPITLDGVALNNSQFCNGTAVRQNEILDLLRTNSFKSGLLNTEKYGFKILTDGFKTYIEPNAKGQLFQLAADSKRYTYIGSLPFEKDFDKSINPMFKESLTDIVDPAYIVAGANKSLPYTNTWGMPNTEELGDRGGGLFSSNLIYNDGVTSTIIPSGPIVAMNYALNFIRTNRKPYTPIGGNITGLIQVPQITSLSKDYSGIERDVFEPAGYNLIIENSRGQLIVNNNASAKQMPKSSLSSLENVMLVNYLAAEVFEILDPVRFNKRNNKEVRDQKVVEVTQLLKRLEVDGAISRFEVKCDSENNTQADIDRGYFIMDTTIYAVSGIKIAVHRTIVKRETEVA